MAQNQEMPPRIDRGPDDDGIQRTSNWWTAAAFNITAIIGLGVLGLPHAMVFLSWYGLAVMVVTCFITYFTLKQLVEWHEMDLIRYETYQDLGDGVFGAPWGQRIILPLQMVVEVSFDVLFTIAVGQAMIRIMGNCHIVHIYVWYAIFGAIQVNLSIRLRNYVAIQRLAIVAAIMSVCYSTIAWISLVSIKHHGGAEYGFNTHQLVENNRGVNVTHTYLDEGERNYQALNAIGVIAFAFAAHNVVLDIQTMLPSPSKEPMMKAVNFTYVVVALCYFPMAIAVYGRYGNKVSSNVLGFMVGKVSRVLVITTNLMLIIHLIGSYQIFAIPIFKFLEGNTRYNRYAIRIVYIVSTISLAIVLPIFSPLLGFFGGLVIAPTTFILPCVLSLCIIGWIPRGWRNLRKEHYINWALIIVGIVIMILAVVGGIDNLIKHLKIYHFYYIFTRNWKSSGFYPHCKND